MGKISLLHMYERRGYPAALGNIFLAFERRKEEDN